jgi:hypothetical protein
VFRPFKNKPVFCKSCWKTMKELQERERLSVFADDDDVEVEE